MINEKLKLLPDKPGCYLMKDKNNNIIYVGKAKNLKNRIKSYFTGSHNAKTTLLIGEIKNFEYIITKSELDAFILELNLIKEHTPKYNIKLMDDKTYPYILLTKNANPQLLVVRKIDKKGQLFGPYPNVTSARNTVRMLNRLYPFRKCHHIPKKECLYYHMKECLAPCINKVKKDEYDEYIKEVSSFLKGDTKHVIEELKKKMQTYSEKMEFEKAKECLDLINSITSTTEKQKISINDGVDRDFINYYEDGTNICIYILFMRNGKIVANDVSVLSLLDEAKDTFYHYIAQYYNKNPLPREIVLPFENELINEIIKANILVPKIGEKKKILDMAYDNAKITLETRKELHMNKQEVKTEALNELSRILDINYPKRIEMFDNSNTLGNYSVSAMVCYINGQKSKKDYRKYKVKTQGVDDYATTKEIVYRRYFRVLMDNLEKPDLIIMDGGKGHLNAVLEVLNSLNINIPAIGLKKNDAHKTDSIIYKDKEYQISGALYQLCFEMQEEVHRFAISFHRTLRNKGMFESKLDNIKGLGKKSKEKLINSFGTIENIRNASLEDFKKIGLGYLYEGIIEAIKK